MKPHTFIVKLTKKQADQIRKEWREHQAYDAATFAQILQGESDWNELKVAIYSPKSAAIIHKAVLKANK